MATFTKSGINTGQTIQATHVTQIIDAFTRSGSYDLLISGSTQFTGSVQSQQGFTGSLLGTASYTMQASASTYTETAERINSSIVATGTTNTTPVPLKVIGGYSVFTAVPFISPISIAATELTAKVLGVDCFVSIGYSSSVNSNEMKVGVDSLSAGQLYFAYDKSGGGTPTTDVEFFYTVTYIP